MELTENLTCDLLRIWMEPRKKQNGEFRRNLLRNGMEPNKNLAGHPVINLERTENMVGPC